MDVHHWLLECNNFIAQGGQEADKAIRVRVCSSNNSDRRNTGQSICLPSPVLLHFKLNQQHTSQNSNCSMCVGHMSSMHSPQHFRMSCPI